MTMIDYVSEWIAANKSKLNEQGVQIAVVEPAERQTKRSIVIDVMVGCYTGTFICWETGECDTAVADLGADIVASMAEVVKTAHYEFKDREELDMALQSFFMDLMRGMKCSACEDHCE